MITYETLKEITANVGGLYPPRDETAAAWWAERGVDHAGLERFCLEDAIDTFENILPMMVAAGNSTADAVGSGYAMCTEVGFILGWIAAQKTAEAAK